LNRLSDEYSKFYLKFIENNKNNGKGTWFSLFNSQSFQTWSGFAFETLCLKHITQLKKALKIESIYSTNSSWFNEHAQIELLIDRADNVINICEIKFHKTPFIIDKNHYLNLKNKISEFQSVAKPKKNIFLTMITTYGLKENEYSRELVQNNLNIGCLFLP
jgi:uncharacterized protein